MKAKKRSRQSRKLKARPRKVSSAGSDTCGYVTKWTLFPDARRCTQVWIPNKMYDKAAADFMKAAKGRREKHMLRQRMAPLGVEVSCEGSCYGGWCREKLISDGGTVKWYICECDYYV